MSGYFRAPVFFAKPLVTHTKSSDWQNAHIHVQHFAFPRHKPMSIILTTQGDDTPDRRTGDMTALDVSFAGREVTFRPHTFGAGKRNWYIAAYLHNDIVLDDGRVFPRQYNLTNAKGNTVWFASYEAAQRRAKEYEKNAKGLRRNLFFGWNVVT